MLQAGSSNQGGQVMSNKRTNYDKEDTKKGDISGKGKPNPKGASSKRRSGYKPSKGKGKSGGPDPKLGEDLRDSVNDPKWYNHTPQLVKDAASLSFYPALGMKVNLNYANTSAKPHFNRIPGIMSFKVTTTYGVSEDSTSPLNTFADNMYRNLRYNYTGSKVYESADLMFYLMVMDSCYQFLAWMQRIYGVCNTYSASNLYMPKHLLKAMDIDYNEFIGNLSEFRRYINDFAIFLNTYYVPANIPMLLRHVTLFQSVFKDSESAKAQLYVFNPRSFYAWDESTTPGKLKQIFVPGDVNFNDIKSIGSQLRNSVNYAQDVRIMSLDVWRAYGAKGVYRAGLIDESYSVIPVYNAMMSTQIENMRVTGSVSAVGPYQDDNGSIIYKPYVVKLSKNGIPDNALADHDILLNAHGDDVTPDWIMEATRLIPIMKMAGFTVEEGNQARCQTDIKSCGSEIVEEMQVWYLDEFDEVSDTNIDTEMVVSSDSSAVAVMTTLSLMSNFDWAPMYYYSTINSSDVSTARSDLAQRKVTNLIRPLGIPCGDVDNYSITNSTVIDNIHTTALMSLLGLPSDPA